MIRIIDTLHNMHSKEIILVLPGYDGEGICSSKELQYRLRSSYEVIFLNYPYYHQTNKAYSLAELVQYVHGFVQSNHIINFHLVGFSMGGFVASAYALKYKKDINSLTLLNSSAYPVLSPAYRALVFLVYCLFKIPTLARLFSRIYCSKLLRQYIKHSPLPIPNNDLHASEGYPVFGTLANIMHSCLKSAYIHNIPTLHIARYAILFEDDDSFPAPVYAPLLSKLGFKVSRQQQGGHAISPDYWSIVATIIRSNLQ